MAPMHAIAIPRPHGHSSPWAAHVFASNYKLHTGALALCALAHVVIVLNVPEATTQHTLGFIATLPLLAGRVALHRHAKPADAQRWASTGWCLSIIVVYTTSVLDPAKASEPADRAAADPLFGMAIFAFCALVGMLHASVAPPRPHSIAVLSVVIAAITVVVAQTHSRAMIAWGAGVLVSHVSGYLLSAHCFEQQAAIARRRGISCGIGVRCQAKLPRSSTWIAGIARGLSPETAVRQTSDALSSASAARSMMSRFGWESAGHECLVSHQGQPTVQPANRMKKALRPAWWPSP